VTGKGTFLGLLATTGTICLNLGKGIPVKFDLVILFLSSLTNKSTIGLRELKGVLFKPLFLSNITFKGVSGVSNSRA
jgi:hypothetical protein